jgi:flagellar basal body-associated protein FliL
VGRSRALIVVALIVVFVVAGGILIYINGHKGGQNLTFDLTVTGAKSMKVDTPAGTDPEKMQAQQNDTITINIKSDTDGEVHLHDYDIAFDTKAGQTVSHTFKADKTCTCEIEWESTSTHLGTLTVSP